MQSFAPPPTPGSWTGYTYPFATPSVHNQLPVEQGSYQGYFPYSHHQYPSTVHPSTYAGFYAGTSFSAPQTWNYPVKTERLTISPPGLLPVSAAEDHASCPEICPADRCPSAEPMATTPAPPESAPEADLVSLFLCSMPLVCVIFFKISISHLFKTI